MSNDIEISPNHGLNPTIPVCFWCGKDKNEIALLGRIRESTTNRFGANITVKGSDLEAPSRMVLGYEPCDDCKRMWDSGIAVIEVQDCPVQAGQPEIQKGLYPTSRFAVITVEGANRVFPQYAPWDKGKRVFVDSTVFSHFMPGEQSTDPAN